MYAPNANLASTPKTTLVNHPVMISIVKLMVALIILQFVPIVKKDILQSMANVRVVVLKIAQNVI